MIRILIKSFNRPYYLDRCLKSIFLNVEGSFEIRIMDDGTPRKYLDKIQEMYPNVEIVLSEHYQSKQDLIIQKKEVDGFKIPIEMWRSEVEKSGEFVLVTEDDVWFCDKVNLEELAAKMKQNNTSLTHLGWLGKKDMSMEMDKNQAEVQYYDLSKIFSSNPILMDWIMYNKYKFFSILYKLGVVDNFTKTEYWKLNSILMGLWQKDYWLYVWKDSKGKVDEKEQLRNAAVWLNKNKKNPKLIAKTTTEKMKTTFQSSATNSYHTYETGFDVFDFNRIINEAWLKGEFDVIQNFPKDFELSYFETFIENEIDKTEFRLWVEKFKETYRKIGADVD